MIERWKQLDHRRTIAMFSDDTELFALSTLLYNKAHAVDKEYWNQFGIDQVELPADTPLVHAMWAVSYTHLRAHET